MLLLALNGFLMLLPSQFGLLKPDDLLVILRALHGFLELFLAFDGIDVHFGVGRPAARISARFPSRPADAGEGERVV